MIRTVQTTVIYCFETRDEKASMSIVVFKHRQRLGIAWAQDNCYGGKLGFCLLPVVSTMSILNKWRKHQMKIIDS